MVKEEIKEVVNELQSNKNILNELESIAERYRNQHIEHNLDQEILSELELLQKKVTRILFHIYLGDINKDYIEGRITSEQKYELSGKKNGYSIEEFIHNLEKLE